MPFIDTEIIIFKSTLYTAHWLVIFSHFSASNSIMLSQLQIQLFGNIIVSTSNFVFIPQTILIYDIQNYAKVTFGWRNDGFRCQSPQVICRFMSILHVLLAHLIQNVWFHVDFSLNLTRPHYYHHFMLVCVHVMALDTTEKRTWPFALQTHCTKMDFLS